MTSKFRSSQSQGYQPEWMTYEVHQALGRIRDPHAAKKACTVLYLAEATSLGTPIADVWRRPGSCSEKVWYGWTDRKLNKRHRGWKDEPAIKAALELATERARWWVRVRQGQAVQDALDVLVGAADLVAHQLVAVATQGRARVTIDDQEAWRPAEVRDILKAADSILDRVSEKTADKGTGKDITIKLTWGETEADDSGNG